MLRLKFVQIQMAGWQALLVVIASLTVRSQKQLSEQLECGCFESRTPFRETYAIDVGRQYDAVTR